MSGVDQHTAQTHYRGALTHPVLSADAEADLAQRIETGLLAEHLLGTRRNGVSDTHDATDDELAWMVTDGAQARTDFINANLKLALATARPFRDRGLSRDDIIQSAYEGLIKAVDRFDFARGTKFSTFAVWWIRETIHEAIQDAEFVRFPDRLHDTIVKVRATTARLSEELGRTPTQAELVDATGLTVRDIDRAQREDKRVVSFDTPISPEATLADVLEDPRAVDRFEDAEAAIDRHLLEWEVSSLLAELPRVEADILTALYGLDGCEPRSVHALTKQFRSSRRTINARRDATLAALSTSKRLAAYA